MKGVTDEMRANKRYDKFLNWTKEEVLAVGFESFCVFSSERIDSDQWCGGQLKINKSLKLLGKMTDYNVEIRIHHILCQKMMCLWKCAISKQRAHYWHCENKQGFCLKWFDFFSCNKLNWTLWSLAKQYICMYPM